MEFKTKIKELRQEKNISQKTLANKIECSQSIICDYENGKSEPSLIMLKKLSNVFNVSIDYLIGNASEDNVIINNTLTANENYIIKLFREMPTEHKTELINYANYLTNKNTKPHTPNNGIDISDLTEMQQAEILGFINGFRNNLFAKNSNK